MTILSIIKYLFFVLVGLIIIKFITGFIPAVIHGIRKRRLNNKAESANEESLQTLDSRNQRSEHYHKLARSWKVVVMAIIVVLGGLYLLITPIILLAAPIAYFLVKIVMLVIGSLIISKIRKPLISALRKAKGFEQRSAEEILNTGEPFGIFLRAYRDEREKNSALPIGSIIGADSATVASRSIEKIVIKALDGVPLITFADPKDPSPMPGAYRFERVPEDWVTMVKSVLRRASYIVAYYSESSPGMLLELDLMRDLNLGDRSLVIIGKRVAAETTTEGKVVRDRLSYFKNAIFEKRDRILSDDHDEIALHNRVRHVLQLMGPANTDAYEKRS